MLYLATHAPSHGTCKGDKFAFLFDQSVRDSWTLRKMNAEEEGFDELKSEGYDEDRLVEPYLAAVGAGGMLLYFPMVLTIGSYHQTMTQSSQGYEVFMADCLPVAAPYSSFEECANYMMENSIGVGAITRTTAMAGENVVTLPPEIADEAALSLCVLQIALSLAYFWAFVRQKLDKKTDSDARENKLLTLISWLPSFTVIVIQVNWAVGSVLFYVNGVKGSGVNLFLNETAVDIEHSTFRDSMLVYTVLGIVCVWALMVYAGWQLMGSDSFNEIVQSEREAKAAEAALELAAEAVEKARREGGTSSGGALGSDGLPGDDEELEGFGFPTEEDDAELDLDNLDKFYVSALEEARVTAKQLLRDKQKKLRKSKLMPPIVVGAFAANMAFKAVPHLILVIIFVNRTSVNGIAFYCLLSLLADVAVSVRVISAWLHNKHPTLNVLAWIEVFVMVSTFFAWRLEIKPHSLPLLHKISLASSVLFIVAIGPILYMCHIILSKDRTKIIDRVDKREAGGIKFEEDEFEEVYEDLSKVHQNAFSASSSTDDGEIYEAMDGKNGDDDDDDDDDGNAVAISTRPTLAAQINAVDEDPNTVIEVGTGIEAIARSQLLVPVFFAMFLLNTVPNIATLGVAIFQRGERRAVFALSMIANTISGLFSLVVICWWARKRSRTFFYTVLVALTNVLGFWLFFGVAVAPLLDGPIVTSSAIFGAVGTILLLPIILRKAWALRRNGVKLTGGKHKDLDGMKGIMLFGERWDNTIVGMLGVLFAWTTAIAVFQIYVLYTSVRGVNLTEFALFCTLVALAATAVPPMAWLHARHPLLMSTTMVAFATLVSSWWSFAVLFPVGSAHFKVYLLFNIVGTAVVFPAVIYTAHRQLLTAHKQKVSHIMQPVRNPSASSARMFSDRKVERRNDAVANIEASGVCVELRLHLLGLFEPFESRFRALMTNERTGTNANYSKRVRWSIGACCVRSASTTPPHCFGLD